MSRVSIFSLKLEVRFYSALIQTILSKQSPPAHFGGGKQHFAFEVLTTDYKKIKAQVLSKGIKITDEVIWKNKQQSFYFEDLEGNILEVIPEGMWG